MLPASSQTLQDSAKLPAGTEIPLKGAQASRLSLQNEKATGKMPVLPYKIASTDKPIDAALAAMEKETPNGAERHRLPRRAARRVRAGARINRKNDPVASVCDRRTLKCRIAGRHRDASKANRRRTKPRKTSDDHGPTLQLQIDPANLASLIDLIATLPFQHADLHIKVILGHDPESYHSNSSSASLGDLCAFAVKNSTSSMNKAIRGLSRHSATTPGLAPNGSMALLLANGSMSSNSSGEDEIRRAVTETDDSWLHRIIRLVPDSMDFIFKSIILEPDKMNHLRVVGEFVGIIG